MHPDEVGRWQGGVSWGNGQEDPSPSPRLLVYVHWTSYYLEKPVKAVGPVGDTSGAGRKREKSLVVGGEERRCLPAHH